MKPLIYIAGPYSSDPVSGLRNAVIAAERVLQAGATPLVPHLTMAWYLVSGHDPAFYYAYDLDILAHCQGLIRLKGESKGADKEVEEAERLGIPVMVLHSGVEDVGIMWFAIEIEQFLLTLKAKPE